MRILVGLAAVMLATPATAAGPGAEQPWSVFGLELGAPLSVPMCNKKVLPSGQQSEFTYEDDPQQTCIEPDIQLRDAPWRRGAVTFPMRRMPDILGMNTGFTLIIDGKLEGLDFATLGYANASAIIDELTTKFGEPSSIEDTTSTVSGVPVPAVLAEWRLPTLYVSYLSIDREIQYGTLRIETPVMRNVRRERERRRDEQRIGL